MNPKLESIRKAMRELAGKRADMEKARQLFAEAHRAWAQAEKDFPL